MDFLSLSPDYWDGPRHNRHYFCEALSKSNRVLFLSPPFYIVKLIREWPTGNLSKSGVRELSPSLVNYVPSKWLFTNHRFPRLNEWMRQRRLKTVHRLMKRHDFSDPVLLVWHPQFRDLVGEFSERLLIYYVYDQYSGYTGGDASKPDPGEIELLEKADVVFALSRGLYEDKKRYSSRVHLLPNAVDYDLFAQSRAASTAVPEDLAEVPRPRIGYIGTINEKVDVPVLEHISDTRPDWSLVLIGRQNYTRTPDKQRFEALVSRRNVHWLQHKEYDVMPACIKGLDVCLMCYVINDWTYYGDPSKMHEYLASGKPTIGTGLPAIREYSGVIPIPSSPSDWVDAIDQGLKEQGDDLAKRRIEVAKRNSYERRVEVAMNVITETLRRSD